MNRMERFRSRRDTTTALDYIHNPEIHLSYQVVNAIVQEYQTGQSPMPEFLQANISNLMVHLERIRSKDPQFSSGFEHDKTKKLWEIVGYILERYLIHFPTGDQHTAVRELFLQLSVTVNEQGESLVDHSLIGMVGELHTHSRPDYLEHLSGSQKERVATSDRILEGVLQQYLSNYTTEGSAILRAWTDSSGLPLDVLSSMRRIERAKTGAITSLMHKFGVANYNRYPESMLIKQVDRQPKPGIDHGMVMGARADHNGALTSTKAVLEQLLEQLGDDCDLIAVEFGTIAELKKRLKVVSGQAKFGLILAHGNRDVIVGGRRRDGADANLSTQQVSAALKTERDAHFTPDATWIISACETGKPGGIAEVMSEDLEINTIAPAFQAGAEDIRVRRTATGSYDFTVRYHDQGLFKRVNKFVRKGV